MAITTSITSLCREKLNQNYDKASSLEAGEAKLKRGENGAMTSARA